MERPVFNRVYDLAETNGLHVEIEIGAKIGNRADAPRALEFLQVRDGTTKKIATRRKIVDGDLEAAAKALMA